jgi:hypothetical protein
MGGFLATVFAFWDWKVPLQVAFDLLPDFNV